MIQEQRVVSATPEDVHLVTPRGRTLRGATRCETIEVTTGEVACQSAWMFQFGTPKNDVVTSVAVDGDHVYFGGSTFGALGAKQSGFGDGFVASLSGTDGELRWSAQFGTAKGDELTGLGILSNGDVVAAGSTFGSWTGHKSSGHLDGWFTTLDAQTGTSKAQVQMGSNRKDTVEAIATTEHDDTVFIGGTTFGHVDTFCSITAEPQEYSSTTNNKNANELRTRPLAENGGHGDAWISKYMYDQGNTHLLWATQIASPRADTLAGIATSDSTLVAVGTTFGDLSNNTTIKIPDENLGRGDAFVARLDQQDGSIIWSTAVGTDMSDEASAVALDANGNVILVGTTFGDMEEEHREDKPGGRDVFVVLLHGNTGDIKWTKLFGSSRNDEVRAVAVGLDDDKIYVAGATHGNFRGSAAGLSDAWLAILNLSNGELLDAVQFGHAERDSLDALALASDGDLILAGSTDGNFAQCNTGGKDIWVARVHPEQAVSFLSAFDHDRHLNQPCGDDNNVRSVSVHEQAAEHLILEEEFLH